MNNQTVQELTKYMADTKKVLKTMSKNDLVRAVSALLLDNKMLKTELERLNGQNGDTLEKTANGTSDSPGATTTAPTGPS